MNKIDKIRKQIDETDLDLVENLIKRLELASDIQKIKSDSNLSVTDSSRESEIINKLKSEFGEKIDDYLLEKLYNLIFSYVKQPKNSSNSQNISDIVNKKPFIISGPCAIEDESQINKIAKIISDKGIKLFRAGAFKPRTAPNSFQGIGENGLLLARKAADNNNLFLVSEILDTEQLENFHHLIDVIQIGSRNMASYQLLKNVGKITAQSKKFVLLKRGWSATLNEFLLAAEYIMQYGNPNVILCLRGIRTFEQIDSKFRNTPDLASIAELKAMTNLPICFDSSHSTGNSSFVEIISKGALALGADGLMIETHHDPNSALIDSQQSITPNMLDSIIDLLRIRL